MPVRSFVTKFRAEFEEHLQADGCPRRAGAEPRQAAALP
jgi:hypothetical protein